jgi:hypothetical protein
VHGVERALDRVKALVEGVLGPPRLAVPDVIHQQRLGSGAAAVPQCNFICKVRVDRVAGAALVLGRRHHRVLLVVLLEVLLAVDAGVDLPGGQRAGDVVPGPGTFGLDVLLALVRQLLDGAALVPGVADPDVLVALGKPGAGGGPEHLDDRLSAGGGLAGLVPAHLGQLGAAAEGVDLVSDTEDEVQALLGVGVGVA